MRSKPPRIYFVINNLGHPAVMAKFERNEFLDIKGGWFSLDKSGGYTYSDTSPKNIIFEFDENKVDTPNSSKLEETVRLVDSLIQKILEQLSTLYELKNAILRNEANLEQENSSEKKL